MIIGFIGDMGSGKTLSMVRIAYILYKKYNYDVYSNIVLNFPFKLLTLDDIIEYSNNDKSFNNSVFLIDEAHIFIDSRSSGSRRNLIISYFILQTRKKNVWLLYTTQYLHQVDKRLRGSTNVFTECYFKSVNDKSFVLNVYNIVASFKTITKYNTFNAIPFYDLYNTYEVVRPL